MSDLLDQTLDLVEKRERARFKAVCGAGTSSVMIDLLKTRAPVKTGETRDRIVGEREDTSGTLWSVEIASKTPQAYLTDVGTGLFGPEAALITPKVKKALHWIDGGEDVFAMSSKGSGKHKGWFSDFVIERFAYLLQLRGEQMS